MSSSDDTTTQWLSDGTGDVVRSDSEVNVLVTDQPLRCPYCLGDRTGVVGQPLWPDGTPEPRQIYLEMGCRSPECRAAYFLSYDLTGGRGTDPSG